MKNINLMHLIIFDEIILGAFQNDTTRALVGVFHRTSNILKFSERKFNFQQMADADKNERSFA